MKADRLLAVGLLLTLTACGRGDTQPQVYRHFTDQLKARYPILGWPCEGREARDCYRFGPAKKMRGLWSTRFEESDFIDSSEAAPTDANALLTNKTWLEVLGSNLPSGINSGDYEIEFIGRKTTVPGRYGQMGESKNMVVVDKLIAIHRVNLESWLTQWVANSRANNSSQTPR